MKDTIFAGAPAPGATRWSPRRVLVTGANGQIGRAVRRLAEERGIAGGFDFAGLDGFDLFKIEAAGFHMPDWEEGLREYVGDLLKTGA